MMTTKEDTTCLIQRPECHTGSKYKTREIIDRPTNTCQVHIPKLSNRLLHPKRDYVEPSYVTICACCYCPGDLRALGCDHVHVLASGVPWEPTLHLHLDQWQSKPG